MAKQPNWRSLMFVPATAERFVAKAHTRGADVIILDLEDSIAPAEKQAARDALFDYRIVRPAGFRPLAERASELH